MNFDLSVERRSESATVGDWSGVNLDDWSGVKLLFSHEKRA